MPHIITGRQPGGTFFFTTRLADRKSSLLVDEIDHLRDAMRKVMARYPFKIDAIAILPHAIHTIWTLPLGDSNHALRWSMLKSTFSRSVPVPDHRSASQQRRKDTGIWQQKYWEHLISAPEDLSAHVQMIHTSPVQAGLCAAPQDWPHSSVHRHIAQTALADEPVDPSPALTPVVEPQLIAPTFREEGFAHHP